ncbi:MAG: hypothetical protein LBH28_09850, partial [Oscillospiraceae bacterium]|nr:hypothetical protein [Oscillospiraceae bacterium]
PWNNWGRGSRSSSYDNANYHYERHGYEVNAKDFNDYLRKADAFKDTVLQRGTRGTCAPGFTDNVYRFSFNGRYIDMEKIIIGGQTVYEIISYGSR